MYRQRHQGVEELIRSLLGSSATFAHPSFAFASTRVCSTGVRQQLRSCFYASRLSGFARLRTHNSSCSDAASCCWRGHHSRKVRIRHHYQRLFTTCSASSYTLGKPAYSPNRAGELLVGCSLLADACASFAQPTGLLRVRLLGGCLQRRCQGPPLLGRGRLRLQPTPGSKRRRLQR